MTLLDRALQFAIKFHAGQVDKSGEMYILHPLRVMLQMETDSERIVAVLHDIVEDTIITHEDVRAVFGKSIAAAVEALTRRPGEPYPAFLYRCKDSPLALRVKLADIADNTNPERLRKLPTEVSARLINKYTRALTILKGDE